MRLPRDVAYRFCCQAAGEARGRLWGLEQVLWGPEWRGSSTLLDAGKGSEAG